MTCRACAIQKRNISLENQEIAHLVNVLRRKGGTDAMHQALRDQQAKRDQYREALDEHQASDECTRTAAPMRARSKPRRQPPTDDGREPCPVCLKPVKPLPTGFLRLHSDKQGYPCANRRRATTTPQGETA